MATSDTYTLVISETGIPSAHAASHTAGGGDEIAVNISQLDDIAANTVLGNLTGATAAVTAVATTGTGNVVRATGPTITLANATGLPLTTGVTGVLPAANGGTGISALGTGVATFLGTPTSANLRGAITDETGTGLLVFANNPEISSPTINGTPVFSTPLSASNGGTGISALGAGVATFLGTPSSANLATAVTGETGTGALVFGTGPILTSPTISGTPTFSNPLTAANGGTGLDTLGAGIPVFLETPSSDSLNAAITDSIGTGSLVFGTNAALITPSISSPTISGSPTFATPLSVANGGTSFSQHSFGQLYMQGGTTTLSVSDTVFQKAAGKDTTFDTSLSSNFSDGGTIYRLTYTGTQTRKFLVYCTIDATGGAANDTIAIALAKNGTVITASECRANTTGSAADPENQHMAKLATSWIVELATNQYIEPFVTVYVGTATLTITVRRCKLVITPV
jgi:hypothetical protein